MVLYVVRHAEALAVGGSIQSDRNRPLSPRGEQDAAMMGDLLACLDDHVGLILSSPLVRAVRTGDIFRQSIGDSIQVRTSDHLAPGFRPRSFLEELQSLRSLAAVIAVGHQPDLSNLLAFLIADSSRASIALPPCAVARVDFESEDLHGRATLHWLLTPHTVRAAHVPSGRGRL